MIVHGLPTARPRQRIWAAAAKEVGAMGLASWNFTAPIFGAGPATRG